MNEGEEERERQTFLSLKVGDLEITQAGNLLDGSVLDRELGFEVAAEGFAFADLAIQRIFEFIFGALQISQLSGLTQTSLLFHRKVCAEIVDLLLLRVDRCLRFGSQQNRQKSCQKR